MTDLVEALRRVAETKRLLVASDFDGTLAPIVELPDSVRPDVPACQALRALGQLELTLAAIISGRARSVLRRFIGPCDVVRLVGSHGAELGEELGLSSLQLRVRDELSAELGKVAERYSGALVEPKPAGVAFHFRRVAPRQKGPALREVAELLEERGVRALSGHEVIEGLLVESDKGVALESLRSGFDATATFFIGDDSTDEDAFSRLGSADLGVRVGAGATRATTRIESQDHVAPVLRHLHELRRTYLRRVREETL